MSDFADIPALDINLPEGTLPEPQIGSSTSTTTMPTLPDFTLPNPSSIPAVSDDAGTLDQRNVVKSEDSKSGRLQGPEADAQTLGEFKMCKICNVYLNSKTQADMHYAGKLHQKKLRQRAMSDASASSTAEVPVSSAAGSLSTEHKSNLYLPHCNICSLTFTGESQVQSHLIGAKHAKKLRQLAQKQELEEFKPEPVKPATESEAFYCKYCDIVCTSQAQLDQHYSGSKHKNVMEGAKNATSNRLNPPPAGSETIKASSMYVCQPCNITANSEQQYLQHCGSAKHNNKILNRPGKDKFRDQPYPTRRGALSGKGKVNNNNYSSKNNNAGRPAWGSGKWTGGSDFFNQNGCFSGSFRPGRGRGRGRGMYYSKGQSYGINPSRSFSNTDQSHTSSSSKLVKYGGGYTASILDSGVGEDGDASVNFTSQGGGRGRCWQGNKKMTFRKQKQWGGYSSDTMFGLSGVPELAQNFVQQSFEFEAQIPSDN